MQVFMPDEFKPTMLEKRSQCVELLLAQMSDLGYVIERGMESINLPLESDIDLLLSEGDKASFVQRVIASGMLLYASNAYGGIRLFIGKTRADIKRIDCTWNLHYRGVPLLSVDRLLTEGIIDTVTDLKTLPEPVMAEIAFAIKNAYGGAEKYRAFLEKHGFSILSSSQRVKWLTGKVLRHPAASIIGAMGCFFNYVRRIWKPTGLMVGGVSPAVLEQSEVIRYLFQRRAIRRYRTVIGLIRSRITSDICVIPWVRFADLDLSHARDLAECEERIISYLQGRRTHLV
jgi:hypothetical protein